MRLRVVIAALVVLALSIISTTFTLLAATSKSWATQAYYFGDISDAGLNETNVTCIFQRSPFYRCGLPQINSTGACNISDCHYYKPYGRDNTSCRSATEFGRSYDEDYLASGLLGQGQECQEVHYAGSLQIAASTFIGLGLLFCLILSGATLVVAASSSDNTTITSAPQSAHSSRHHRHHDETEKSAATSSGHSQPSSEGTKTGLTSFAAYIPFVVAALLTCLYIGALTQILAQYFGVLGLTINATPKDTLAAQNAVALDQFRNNFQTDTWVIGKGLSTYATIAWASAVACAALATMLFRTPQFPKVL